MAKILDTDNTYKILKTNCSNSGEYNTMSVQFGDGYRQSTIDGINYDRETWNLTFVPLDSTTCVVLKNLLKNSQNGTANLLSWTPPGESATKYWSASRINMNSTEIYDYWQVSCILTREFPLVV